MDDNEDSDHPTQEQIAERCAEIQATWTEADRLARKQARVTHPYYDPHCERNARAALNARLSSEREKMRQRPA
jgi:hypothetical protein